MRKIFIIQLFLFLICFVAFTAYAQDGGVENLKQTGKAFASVAKSVSPSVVFIQTESKVSNSTITRFSSPFGDEWPFGDDIFKRFFGDDFPGIPRGPRSETSPNERQAIGQGSGFVFATKRSMLSDNKTYILTNNHVIADADRILVKFQDGREYEAKVTGRDPQSDIAVIEINVDGMPPLSFADSSNLEVGEWVVAIGNPFGLSHTLTVGVVSATGRTSLGINDYEDFIQTDAAINPGNSGGPLVNLDGEVVGINTAIFSRSGGYMGVGFAIPINLGKTIANQLIEKGEVTRGYIGVMIQPLTTELAESFNIDSVQGILIAQVTKDSPADKAGLHQGDVIIAYNDKSVKDIGGFRNLISLMPPGSRITLTILREGKKKNVTIVVGNLPKNNQVAQGATQSTADIGLTVQTLTPQLAEQFDAKPGEGVVITKVQPGSIAAMSGIKAGTIILQVDRKAIDNAEEFQRVVKASSGDKRLLLLIREGNAQRYIALRW
ncbi:DegQ family serine endoprotease [Nitrosomonas supralitoralis]|uniref:Serine protease n=1 Tax=Nitrosomonas supralitoralis TaxID=2116706 RepID=A0A2P7NWL2_9PROT|nr:DegQ family serine endoprotease [Nitrosomonas supralitoralis]PSJ17856.1 serine protease [Nitrosomonas supralitoralis]